MKQFALKSIAFLFVFISLISSTGFCAPLLPLSDQDKQTILQQSAVQPPEGAKVTDVWLEPADLMLETKTIQASIGEFLRIVLVSPPNNREWQNVDDKPRFLEKLHSQEMALYTLGVESRSASLFLFKVQDNASGVDRLTFVQYQNSDGKKEAVSMLDIGVQYFSPELRKKI